MGLETALWDLLKICFLTEPFIKHTLKIRTAFVLFTLQANHRNIAEQWLGDSTCHCSPFQRFVSISSPSFMLFCGFQVQPACMPVSPLHWSQYSSLLPLHLPWVTCWALNIFNICTITLPWASTWVQLHSPCLWKWGRSFAQPALFDSERLA